jgi:Flp pilus assembly protein TadG
VTVLRGVRSHLPRGDHGQSLVEFALFAPLFFFLVLGAADFARVFYYNIAITNIAREGARHGAYFDPSTGGNTYATASGIMAAVNNEASYLGASNLTEQSSPGTAGTCPTVTDSNTHHMPPYASNQWPTTDNSGYVYICFNDADTNATVSAGQPLRVTVLYTFTPMTPVIWNFLGNNGRLHVTGTAEFLTEGL